MISRTLLTAACLAFCALGAGADDLGPPYGNLPLVDQVDCATAPTGRYAEAPAGSVRVERLLGADCRVVGPTDAAPGPGYYAYKLGAGKGLKAGSVYVLAADFPEDKPRSVHIVNRGCEAFQGFHTGPTFGDCLLGYTANNIESLDAPLSGKMRTWTQAFRLYDRFYGIRRERGQAEHPDGPADGFWVIIFHPGRADDPASAGAAVSRLRLYAAPDVARLYAPLPKLPDGLPMRSLFTREEMPDGYAEGDHGRNAGVADMATFFQWKAQSMRLLGMNTFCKDLLEFGHNQGWDAGDDSWYTPHWEPQRWERMVADADALGLSILPYYEYTGSMGLNKLVKCVPMKGEGKPYTSIWWTEINHLDVTDPRSVDDAKRLLDRTVGRFKAKGRFLGAWFRMRVGAWPLSFSEACLARYRTDASLSAPVTREALQADAALKARYTDWWLGKRKQFLVTLRDHLRSLLGSSALLLWTNWNNEAGPTLTGGKIVVADDPNRFRTTPNKTPRDRDPRPELPEWWQCLSLSEVTANGRYPASITSPPEPWSDSEFDHAEPRADPERYRDTPGVLFTYPISRAFTTARAADMEAFRGPSGLAAVRFQPLNEHRDEKLLGDFLSDVEFAGPLCMLPEVRAVAYGDPWMLGRLVGSTPMRGFPQYARRFHAAYLALPALPSKVRPDACGTPEVVVRAIATPRSGTYYSVAHVGLRPRAGVTVRVPGMGAVRDAVTGKPLGTAGAGANRTVRLDLDACELRALVVK